MSSSVNDHHQHQISPTSHAQLCLKVDELCRIVGDFKSVIQSATLSKSEVSQSIDSLKEMVTEKLSDLVRIDFDEQAQPTTRTTTAAANTSSTNQQVHKCGKALCGFETNSLDLFAQHKQFHPEVPKLVSTENDSESGQDDAVDQLPGPEPNISVNLSANGVSNPGTISVRAEDNQSTPKVRKGKKARRNRVRIGHGGAGGNGSSGSGAIATSRIQEEEILNFDLVNQNRDEAHDDAQEAEDQIAPDVADADAQAATPPNQQNHNQNRDDQEGSNRDGANDDQNDQDDQDAENRIDRNAGADDDDAIIIDGDQEAEDQVDRNAVADDVDDDDAIIIDGDQEAEDQVDRNAVADDVDDAITIDGDQEAEDQVDRNAAPQPGTPKPYNLRKSTLTRTPSKSYNYYVEDVRKMPTQTSKSSGTERFVLNRTNLATINFAKILKTIERYDPRIKEYLQSNQNQQVDQVTVQCKQTR